MWRDAYYDIWVASSQTCSEQTTAQDFENIAAVPTWPKPYSDQRIRKVKQTLVTCRAEVIAASIAEPNMALVISPGRRLSPST